MDAGAQFVGNGVECHNKCTLNSLGYGRRARATTAAQIFKGSNLSNAREQRDANGTCLGLVTAETARMTASDPEADLDLGWRRIEVSHSLRGHEDRKSTRLNSSHSQSS